MLCRTSMLKGFSLISKGARIAVVPLTKSRVFTSFRNLAPFFQSHRNISIPAKKLKNYQNLRRKTDPISQEESTNYILSLLPQNDSVPKNLEKYLSNVTAVTIGDEINFDKLILLLNNANFTFQIVIPQEVINIQFDQHTHLMILSNGTLIGWNMSEEIMVKDYLPLIKTSINELYTPESDEMFWVELDKLPANPYNNGNSYLQGEILVIQGATSNKKLLDKAAFAIGLSRSTRLSILEDALEEHLQLTKQNSVLLSQGKINTNEHKLLKLTGRLFLLRGKLNLYSELIEIPDLYWEEPSLEKNYYSISKVLDINSRISILNRKLDYATEEQRAFLSVLNEKKSTRLEWIIIILIMVEVGFESFHFYERYYSDEIDDHKA